jgi:MoaA/NifB/PqqE/SkfB family radical SAM enzyme
MFCPRPFREFHIDQDGEVNPCCKDWIPVSYGNILKAKRPLDVLNSDMAKSVRASMLDGSFKYCTKCPHLPGPSGSVMLEPRPDLKINPDMTVDHIELLMLNYDQTCNLTCRSCRPGIIAKAGAKAERIHDLVMNGGIIDVSDEVYITAAGDPFASPLFRSFLKDLANRESHPKRVALHTNGQLLDEAHWKAMGATADLISGIHVSVDAGTPETYKLNRGSDWERLWRNLDFVRSMKWAGKHFGLYFRYVIQANNFREVIPFCRMALKYAPTDITFYYLRNWGTYTPEEYRQRSVYLKDHQDYAEFAKVMTDPEFASNPLITLPTFPPPDSL